MTAREDSQVLVRMPAELKADLEDLVHDIKESGEKTSQNKKIVQYVKEGIQRDRGKKGREQIDESIQLQSATRKRRGTNSRPGDHS